MENPIAENHFDTADKLWKYLSPVHVPPEEEGEFLYRGQSNASWHLTPSIYRRNVTELFEDILDEQLTSEGQALMEFQMIEHFVIHCDACGIPTPSEAKIFRDYRSRNNALRNYLKFPSSWPESDLIVIMAMARMHGLPARLLDWSDNPYVAVYFAASDALRVRRQWQSDDRLAIWKLTTPHRRSLENWGTLVYCAPGTISRNIVAQQGLFTLLPIYQKQNELFGIRSMEDILPKYKGQTLEKMTVPVTESYRLYQLCGLIGLNSARMYPGADGASMAVMDTFLYSVARRSSENPNSE